MSNYTNSNLDSISESEDSDFYYEEVFVTKNTVYTYSNMVGFSLPYEYIIREDSLFIGIKTDSTNFKFKARVNKINEYELLLIDSLNRKGSLFRVLNEEFTLDKFINLKSKYPKFEQNNTEFSQAFNYRSEAYKLKFKKD
ncbi:hypothetical protein [Polaribacter sp. SA4-12]|uniref:hypothetical protein n=1 Tax=Polaribacter sp. SA4-12 TaxID=1312072 RepID=UPI0012FBEBCD|nr:hypothetical protein [Polaribacter sp. SA4-12]